LGCRQDMYICTYTNNMRVCVRVCVCVYVYTGMFPILDCTRDSEWWKVVAHLSTALCWLCSTSGSSAQDSAEAETQLEVCI